MTTITIQDNGGDEFTGAAVAVTTASYVEIFRIRAHGRSLDLLSRSDRLI